MGKISKEVYSPSEDSWLLEECILKENLVGKKCLDLGSGSGIQSVALFKAGASEVLSVDINPLALIETKKKVNDFLSKQKKNNKTQIPGHSPKYRGARKSNLFSAVKEKFDFIVFNPPYVPSDEIKWVDLDGGEKGRVIIDKFLPQVKKYLNKQGVLLLLLSSLNKPNEVSSILKKEGFSVKVIAKKKLFFEELVVLRVVKN
ncbi:MAG: HemK2/MTQ2 family protein methyltransferase [archaeon]